MNLATAERLADLWLKAQALTKTLEKFQGFPNTSVYQADLFSARHELIKEFIKVLEDSKT